MIKIGYGQSNYKNMVKDDFYYVDRTDYIALIENMGSHFLFFLRPRRFGKSLFISTLEYYYGLQHKAEFDYLFGQRYIGKNPTPLANSYLVLIIKLTPPLRLEWSIIQVFFAHESKPLPV